MKPCMKQILKEHFQKVGGTSFKTQLFRRIVEQTRVLAATESVASIIGRTTLPYSVRRNVIVPPPA